MNALNPALQMELLTPEQIDAAWAEAPIAYVPLGTYEFHGKHLPVGFDALAAHFLCLRAAARTGGLVLPPLYYGTGGGHGEYPHTIMVEGAQIRPLLDRTVERLSDFGVRIVVLLSGHFPQEQVDLVTGAARDLSTGTRKVIGLVTGMVKDPPIRPDHAALFETSLMHALAPSLVHLERLPSLAEAPANDPEGNGWGAHRHDPSHVLHGIFGEDPRLLDPAKAEELVQAVEHWLVKQVVTAKVELGLL